MDYKRTEIRERLEEWIMQSVHHGDEVIKNYKIIDPEKDGEKYYEIFNHIMHGFFENNKEYDMTFDEACKWIGDARMVYQLEDFVEENDGDVRELRGNPVGLVSDYVKIIGEELVHEWMSNPKYSYDH